MAQPVRYAPDVEQPQPDEAETIAGLEEQFKKILDTTSHDYGHAVHAVYAKGHGIARGTLSVPDDLPPELAQGLFATPGIYEAILRFSTNAGDILNDSTQDFVLVNAPAFAAPDPQEIPDEPEDACRDH
jgi:hypothetical protein